MKKLYALIIPCLLAASTYAQEATSIIFSGVPGRTAVNRQAINDLNNRPVFDRTNQQHNGGSTQRTTSASGSRWYNYADMLSSFVTVGYSAVYLWNDTLSRDVYSAAGGGSEYDYNNLINVGLVLDPFDARWNDPFAYAGLNELTPGNAYTIDSVFISGIYMRNNAHTAPVDTLTIAVAYGDGSLTSDIHNFGIDTTGGRTWIPQEYGTDSLYYSRIKYDSVDNRLDTFAGGFTPVVSKIMLHNTDTSASFSRAIPVSINVPAGSVPAMSLSFKSGDPAFTPGDSVFQSTATGFTYKYGMFRPYVAFQGSSAAPEFPANSSHDRSEGQFVSVSTYNTYKYTPHWFFYNSSTNGASTWQYPNFAFHITCATCNLLSTPTVQKDAVAVSAYPDPASAQVAVSFRLGRPADAVVRLVNLMGQVVATSNIASATEGKAIFNTTELPAGVYIYDVTAGAAHTSGRIVVAH